MRSHHWEIILLWFMFVLGKVAIAHEGSAAVELSGVVESNGGDRSWFDPTLPGIPSHSDAHRRRNSPYLDPLRSPEVMPVSNSPLLSSLLGKWREIDPPYSAYFRSTGPDAVASGTLECSAVQGGTVVETRWLRTWATDVLPRTDVRNFLFATDENFYLHRILDHGKSLQLAGGSADSVGAHVAHFWQYTTEGEEWRLVSPDTLKLHVWQGRGDGWRGTVLIEDHVFTRMKD